MKDEEHKTRLERYGRNCVILLDFVELVQRTQKGALKRGAEHTLERWRKANKRID